MAHKELRRIVEGADTAVLFIHGIVGTPDHFSAFVDLVPQGFSVVNLLLEGHGKGVRDFSRASMKKWELQVEQTVKELSVSHDNIYIAAHSMGCLFAIEQAIKCKIIKSLFLLAAPLKIRVTSGMFSTSAKVYFDKIKPCDHVAIAAKNCYGIEPCRNPFLYLGWIPRYLELFAKIRKTRKLMGFLSTKTMVFQSACDELVSAKSEKYLRTSADITIVKLKGSGHYYYDKNDFELLLREFEKLFIE